MCCHVKYCVVLDSVNPHSVRACECVWPVCTQFMSWTKFRAIHLYNNDFIRRMRASLCVLRSYSQTLLHAHVQPCVYTTSVPVVSHRGECSPHRNAYSVDLIWTTTGHGRLCNGLSILHKYLTIINMLCYSARSIRPSLRASISHSTAPQNKHPARRNTAAIGRRVPQHNDSTNRIKA